jgi:hypothetical protein
MPTDEIPWTPLASFGLDRLQVIIGEHELGIGEARFRLGLKLVKQARRLGASESRHGGSRSLLEWKWQ